MRFRAIVALGIVLAPGLSGAQPPPVAPEVHHVHGLALDRRDPEILYVATHTGLVRIGPRGRAERVGTQSFDLMGFTAHPSEAGLVYASGHPDPATYQRRGVGNLGLLVSRDGGQTWRSVALEGHADFHALAWSPHDGGQLYGWSVAGQVGLYRISAATWAWERLPALGLGDVFALAAGADPAGPLLAGPKTGLMMSRDRGVTWVRVPSIPGDAPVTAVAYHSADARLAYAYVGRAGLGLLRSRDGGTTWEPTRFVADPKAPVVAISAGPGDHVAVATTRSDVLRSQDGGRTWQPVLERGRPVVATR